MKIEYLFHFFTIIGIISFIYFLITGIHEYGHIQEAQKQGVKITEVCLLGWRENLTNKFGAGSGTGWVFTEREDYDKSFSVWWDCLFGCNKTAVEEYYGVKNE
jgi:hypothetical protein